MCYILPNSIRICLGRARVVMAMFWHYICSKMIRLPLGRARMEGKRQRSALPSSRVQKKWYHIRM